MGLLDGSAVDATSAAPAAATAAVSAVGGRHHIETLPLIIRSVSVTIPATTSEQSNILRII